MKRFSLILISWALLLQWGCQFDSETSRPRLSMFIGVDISGSFKRTADYADALDFLSYYIYSHLNGLGGLEVPNVLFVSSIGGSTAGEPKTFYPIQTFENKTIPQIREKLEEIFTAGAINPFTDYNAFFEQIAHVVRTKNLVLRPISVVMLSDGVPDIKKKDATDFASIQLEPLERLARNVTVRLLYTDAVTGNQWQTRVKRRRVKLWTQDAEVLRSWKDPVILNVEADLDTQSHFFSWVHDNVDFGVRARRVD